MLHGSKLRFLSINIHVNIVWVKAYLIKGARQLLGMESTNPMTGERYVRDSLLV